MFPYFQQISAVCVLLVCCGGGGNLQPSPREALPCVSPPRNWCWLCSFLLHPDGGRCCVGKGAVTSGWVLVFTAIFRDATYVEDKHTYFLSVNISGGADSSLSHNSFVTFSGLTGKTDTCLSLMPRVLSSYHQLHSKFQLERLSRSPSLMANMHKLM